MIPASNPAPRLLAAMRISAVVVLCAGLAPLAGCGDPTPSEDPPADPTPADPTPSWSPDATFPWDADDLSDCAPEPAPPPTPAIVELPPATDLPMVWFPDNDCDGYGRPGDSFVISATPVWGYAPNGEDCDDGDRWVPVPERHCDGIDNDCDGVELCDVDADTAAELMDAIALGRSLVDGGWTERVVGDLVATLPAPGSCPLAGDVPLVDGLNVVRGSWRGPCATDDGGTTGELGVDRVGPDGTWEAEREAFIDADRFLWIDADGMVRVEGSAASWHMGTYDTLEAESSWELATSGLPVLAPWDGVAVRGHRTSTGWWDVEGGPTETEVAACMEATSAVGPLRIALTVNDWSDSDVDGVRECLPEFRGGTWDLTLPSGALATLRWNGGENPFPCRRYTKAFGGFWDHRGCDGCPVLTLDGVEIGPWCPPGTGPALQR